MTYNSKIIRYESRWKTLGLVFQNYWQSQISRYIDQYISVYNLCMHMKIAHHLLFMEFHLLFVSDFKCKTINIDFIIELSKFIVFDTIMIVVDSISKKMHFILTYNTITIEGTARLLLYYIQKLHSLKQKSVVCYILHQETLFYAWNQDYFIYSIAFLVRQINGMH